MTLAACTQAEAQRLQATEWPGSLASGRIQPSYKRLLVLVTVPLQPESHEFLQPGGARAEPTVTDTVGPPACPAPAGEPGAPGRTRTRILITASDLKSVVALRNLSYPHSLLLGGLGLSDRSDSNLFRLAPARLLRFVACGSAPDLSAAEGFRITAKKY